MCVILKDTKHLSRTFAGCILDAQTWRDWAEKTPDSHAKEKLIAAAATVEHLARYLAIKVNQ